MQTHGIEIRYHTLRKRYLRIPGNFLSSVCFYLHADHVASACRRRRFAWVEVGADDDRKGGKVFVPFERRSRTIE